MLGEKFYDSIYVHVSQNLFYAGGERRATPISEANDHYDDGGDEHSLSQQSHPLNALRAGVAYGALLRSGKSRKSGAFFPRLF